MITFAPFTQNNEERELPAPLTRREAELLDEVAGHDLVASVQVLDRDSDGVWIAIEAEPTDGWNMLRVYEVLVISDKGIAEETNGRPCYAYSLDQLDEEANERAAEAAYERSQC